MPNEVNISGDYLIRIADVVKLCATSRASVYRAIRRGKFPAPVKTFMGASRWVRSEIEQWIAERVQAREAGRK